MLTIHHLGHSQSERILWLCEELGIPYTLKRYTRDAVTKLSPPELSTLHPLTAAPLIEDGGIQLAESAAIVEYIIVKHGNGRLKLGPDHPEYVPFLYWFHFSNGNLQPVMGRSMIVSRLNLPPEHPVRQSAALRQARALRLVDNRLGDNRLGEAPYLAGTEFTAADIMTVFSLTTMRLFIPTDLTPYPSILAYLQRIGARPAYQRAMQKGDPDLVPLLT
jgi:glutathione S-transferase